MKIAEEDYKKVAPLATVLFKQCFNELMTGVENSIKNFKNAQWRDFSGHTYDYFKGKEDAFQEIAERINKEIQMTGFIQETLDGFTEIKISKDSDINKMLPIEDTNNRFRGSIDYNYCMRYRRTLAELLDKYFIQGVMFGLKIASNSDDKESPKFNSSEFFNTCMDAFIHPYTKMMGYEE